MIENLLEKYDFSMLDRMTKQSVGDSFSVLLKYLLCADFEGVGNALVNLMKAILVPGMDQARELATKLLLFGLLAMLLKYFVMLVKNKQVTDIAYYFVYLLLMLYLMDMFDGIYTLADSTINSLREFMIALIPAYCLSLSIANGVASASANYQIMIWLLSGVCYILKSLLLPLTQCYIFLVFMNGIDDRKRMRGFIKLATKAINIGIRLCITVVLSISTLENLMVAQIDGLQKTVVQKMISVIPGIGDLSDSVTQVFMHSAGVIRNGIGVAAILVLFVMCLNPLLKIFTLSFAVKLVSALLGFMGLDRMAEMVSQAGDGCMQVLKITLCSMLMFAVVIAVTLSVLGRAI